MEPLTKSSPLKLSTKRERKRERKGERGSEREREGGRYFQYNPFVDVDGVVLNDVLQG